MNIFPARKKRNAQADTVAADIAVTLINLYRAGAVLFFAIRFVLNRGGNAFIYRIVNGFADFK